MDRRIQCPVDDAAPVVTSKEVNAFRILPETGRAYFLDFIPYSPASQKAEVVSRMRVHEDALHAIRERLSSDIKDAPSTGITIIWPEGMS